MHVLRGEEAQDSEALGRPYAAVTVKLGDRRELVIQEGVTVAKGDALFAPVPDRIKVVRADGKPVKPSKGKRFWISVETFDPYHLVVEADELPLSSKR